MSSVTAPNPGTSDLLQIFAGSVSSPLPSQLSSTAVKSALQSAPPADLVSLSEQALQLQKVAGLFGTGTTATDPATQLLQALNQAAPVTPASSASAAPETPAQQEASALANSLSAANSTVSYLG
jgi:hypothetical protein